MSHLKTTELVRYTSNTSETLVPGPDTPMPSSVLIVGSGAVHNSWGPVISVLQKVIRSPNESGVANGYDLERYAGHELARLSFFHRLYRNAVIKRPELMQRTEIISLLNFYRKFREDLCEEFRTSESNRSIYIRDTFENIMDYINPSLDGVVTINWDQLLWSNPRAYPNLVQLHGCVANPRSLVFPTELAAEEDILNFVTPRQYAKIKGANSIDDATDAEYRKQWQRGESLNELMIAHAIAMKWLASAKRLVIFGVAFNLYDAELNSILGNAAEETELEDLVVFDIDPNKKSLASHFANIAPHKVQFIQL